LQRCGLAAYKQIGQKHIRAASDFSNQRKESKQMDRECGNCNHIMILDGCSVCARDGPSLGRDRCKDIQGRAFFVDEVLWPKVRLDAKCGHFDPDLAKNSKTLADLRWQINSLRSDKNCAERQVKAKDKQLARLRKRLKNVKAKDALRVSTKKKAAKKKKTKALK
jgi:hypothetical protein